jgi:hypothetical protein
LIVLGRSRWVPPPALHANLLAEIYRREASTPSHPTHNRGGWRSGEDVLTWPVPGIELFAAHLRASVIAMPRSWLLPPLRSWRAWAVVNRAGSYHGNHVHAHAALSGVYYLTDGGAATVFESDPVERVVPEVGKLVLFPPTLWHRTEPHTDAAPRVTIAFDALP